MDPRFDDREYREVVDLTALEGLREWARRTDGELFRPTGRSLRNLNPLLTGLSTLQPGWWGYLVDGAPASFASINTRSERLADAKRPLPGRAIVPVTYWREMAKPSRVWHHFTAGENSLLGLAAVTRPGRTADGVEYTCYSIVMQPAAPHLAHIHDRMPLLIGSGFAEEWLAAGSPGAALIGAAIEAASPIDETIRAAPAGHENTPEDPARLF